MDITQKSVTVGNVAIRPSLGGHKIIWWHSEKAILMSIVGYTSKLICGWAIDESGNTPIVLRASRGAKETFRHRGFLLRIRAGAEALLSPGMGR